MNEEIKKKAMAKLDKLYPEEMTIYKRWERCIDMYTAGFHNVPESVEKLLEKIDFDNHFDDGQGMEEMSLVLCFANYTIAHQSSAGWCAFFKKLKHPEYLILAQLLCTIQGRMTGQKAIDIFQINEGYLRNIAIDMLTDLHPDEQGFFHDVDESLNFYNAGFQDAVTAVVNHWMCMNYKDAVKTLLTDFNDALSKKCPIQKIKDELLASAPTKIKPLLYLLLDCVPGNK